MAEADVPSIHLVSGQGIFKLYTLELTSLPLPLPLSLSLSLPSRSSSAS